MVDETARRDHGSNPHHEGTQGPPTTVILFGATGDLSRRKLLPGLLHLMRSGLLPSLQVVGTSLEDYTRDTFIDFAHQAIEEFGDDVDSGEWDAFAKRLFWAGPGVDHLRAAVAEAEADLTEPQCRLAY